MECLKPSPMKVPMRIVRKNKDGKQFIETVGLNFVVKWTKCNPIHSISEQSLNNIAIANLPRQQLYKMMIINGT